MPVNEWSISRKKMCEFFEVTWSTIEKRLKMFDCPKEEIVLERNTYDLKAYTNWLLNYFIPKQNKASDMAAEKLRHEKYKADKAMYDAEERANELLSKSEVVSAISFIITGTKNKFLAWIKRLPPLLEHKSAREIEPILQEELYNILSDLAKGMKAIIPKSRKKESETAFCP